MRSSGVTSVQSMSLIVSHQTGRQKLMMRRHSGACWYSSVALSGGVRPASMYALLIGVSPWRSEFAMALRRFPVQSMSLIVLHRPFLLAPTSTRGQI